MYVRKLLESFKYAIEGVLYCLKTQRNMRIHAVAAVAVLTASSFLKLSKTDVILIVFAIALVVICEMINTAVEKTIDIITNKYHPFAKIAKDVAAGAVFIAALNSLVVAYLVFFNKVLPATARVIDKIKAVPIHGVFISLIATLFITALIKLACDKNKIVQGGMPSGHAAVAFSLVMAVFLLSQNTLVNVLALLLGIVVVQSRIEAKIHSILEVLFGSILGGSVTLLVFKILKIT